MYQNESDLQLIPIESLSKMSTWYNKVKHMYKHIAYELRYEYLSSIAWLNMHESTIYLITLIKLFVHIDRNNILLEC